MLDRLQLHGLGKVILGDAMVGWSFKGRTATVSVNGSGLTTQGRTATELKVGWNINGWTTPGGVGGAGWTRHGRTATKFIAKGIGVGVAGRGFQPRTPKELAKGFGASGAG